MLNFLVFCFFIFNFFGISYVDTNDDTNPFVFRQAPLTLSVSWNRHANAQRSQIPILFRGFLFIGLLLTFSIKRAQQIPFVVVNCIDDGRHRSPPILARLQ